jgi:HEAT repeat protein
MNRKYSFGTLVATLAMTCLLASPLAAQPARSTSDPESKDALKLAAIEALMGADEERALPVLIRTMNSDNSVEVKSRALFVLSQIDLPEAKEMLVATTRSEEPELRFEAIRNIGINGDPDLLQQLAAIYAEGDEETREAVLEAYLIADDSEAIYQVAAAAQSEEEFEEAVQMLGAMGAIEQINRLRDHPDAGNSLVQAYAIAGETEQLISLARDSSRPERQLEAIRGLGIAGDAPARAELLALYQANSDPEIREAVTEAMMIAGDDEAVVSLFKAATDDKEKARLLRILVMMDSDAAMEAIDAALSGELL